MKKAIRIAIAILICILSAGMVVRLLPSSPSPSPVPDSSEASKNTIEYKAVIADEVCEVPDFLFQSSGEYPSKYESGAVVKVDDLKGRIIKTPVPEAWGMGEAYIATGGCPDPNNLNKEYEFTGWYLDSELTEAFEGSFSSAGKQTLYAGLCISTWTNFY